MPIIIDQLEKKYKAASDPSSPQFKKLGWLFIPDSKTGEIYHHAREETYENTPNSCWEISISIDPDPQKMPMAVKLIAEVLNQEDSPKVNIRFVTLSSANAKYKPPSQQAAFTFYPEELKHPAKITNFLSLIETALRSENIGMDEREINSRSTFKPKHHAFILDIHEQPTRFSYRDTHCEIMPENFFSNDQLTTSHSFTGEVRKPISSPHKTCVSENFYERLPAHKKHNPANNKDPFAKLRILPTLVTSPSPLEQWVKATKEVSGLVPFTSGLELKNITRKKVGTPLKEVWKFHIAVYPTRKNLNKAVQALAMVFSKEKYKGIVFQCLVLNDQKKEAMAALGWDGTQQITLECASDSDQRGKEIGIYAAYDSPTHQYQLTPEECKQLMLHCWKALLDKQVEGIGYTFTPAGDKSLPGIVSPFSYTREKPSQNGKGGWLQTDDNTYETPDPLQKVAITAFDLFLWRIPLEQSRQMTEKRITYLKDHSKLSENLIQKELESLKTPFGTPPDFETALSNLQDSASRYDELKSDHAIEEAKKKKENSEAIDPLQATVDRIKEAIGKQVLVEATEAMRDETIPSDKGITEKQVVGEVKKTTEEQIISVEVEKTAGEQTSEIRDALEKNIDLLLSLLPREETSFLTSNLAAALNQCKKDLQRDALAIPALNQVIDSLQSFKKTTRKGEILSIIKNFESTPAIKVQLEECKIESEQLHTIIDTHPAQMQHLFRKMVHLEREKNALAHLIQSQETHKEQNEEIAPFIFSSPSPLSQPEKQEDLDKNSPLSLSSPLSPQKKQEPSDQKSTSPKTPLLSARSPFSDEESKEAGMTTEYLQKPAKDDPNNSFKTKQAVTVSAGTASHNAMPYQPCLLITQAVKGMLANQPVITPETEIDDGNSLIFATSDLSMTIENHAETKSSKTGDDAIIIGYTSEGLPCQILIGNFRDSDNDAFGFIDCHVIPLIDDYAEKLSMGRDVKATLTELIKTIVERRAEWACRSHFTISLAITYKKNRTLYCAGFGIGDLGLVVHRKATNNIEQLTYKTQIQNHSSPGKLYNDRINDDTHFTLDTESQYLNKIVDRGCLFNVPVDPKDELFGYTFLMEDLTAKHTDNSQSTHTTTTAQPDVKKISDCSTIPAKNVKDSHHTHSVPKEVYNHKKPKAGKKQDNNHSAGFAENSAPLNTSTPGSQDVYENKEAKPKTNPNVAILAGTAANDLIGSATECWTKFRFASEKFTDTPSLFYIVARANHQAFVAARKRALKLEQGFAQVGKDCMLGTITIPPYELQKKLQTKRFLQERERFTQLLAQQKDHGVRSTGNKVKESIDKIKESIDKLPPSEHDYSLLTRYLIKCSRALAASSQTFANVQAVITAANQAQGKPSLLWKALGIALMGFGITLATIGGIALVGSVFSAASGVLAPISTLAMPVGAGLTASGVMLFAVGLTCFQQGRRTQISKDLHTFANRLRDIKCQRHTTRPHWWCKP